jgi:hypothetical protein
MTTPEYNEHPVNQPIVAIQFASDVASDVYRIGDRNGVTRIEACEKSGMHAMIPYIRVWRGDLCLAEFCQHSIVGVWFT